MIFNKVGKKGTLFLFCFLLSLFFISLVSGGFGYDNPKLPKLKGKTFGNHLPSFYMPLNTSIFGNFSFNGGWGDGGLSIIDGDIYAQTGYFYNISSLNVTQQNLTILENLNVLENVTASWFFGNMDWSNIQNPPSIAGAWNRSGTDVILANTGDMVGIGDTDPENFLEVVGGMIVRGAVGEGNIAPVNGVYIEEELFVGGSGVANDEINMYEPQPGQYTTMRMSNADSGGGATNGFMLRLGTVLTNDTTFWNYEDGYLDFGTNNSLALRINSSGNVGIGTTSPDSKLQIDGNFTSETDSTDSIGTLAIKWLSGFFVNLLVSGDLNVTGLIINDAIYCESSELVDQTFATAGVRYRLNISNVDEGNGITMSTGTNGTNITIDTSGVYHLVAQPQVKAGAGGAGDFHMWIEKHNTTKWVDISDSNIELKLSSLEEDVIVLATTLKLNQGEKLRFVVSVSDNKILLHAQSPAGEPVIPSIIFTMYRVGN